MTDATPTPARRPRRKDPQTQPSTPVPPADMPAADSIPAEMTEPGGRAAEATLRVERAGLVEASAGNLDLRMGAIGALDAEEVFVQWGAVGAARAERLDVELGTLGAALAGEARMSLGIAGSVAARDAVLEQSFVRTLIAQRVTANRPTGVVVMIAQHVSGDVRPLLDWRGAIFAGAAFGLVTAAVRVIRGRD